MIATSSMSRNGSQIDEDNDQSLVDRNISFSEILQRSSVKDTPENQLAELFVEKCAENISEDGKQSLTVTFRNGNVLECGFTDGSFSGDGRYSWKDNFEYEGNFEENKFHNCGKYTWKNGCTYEGAVENGKRSGNGELTQPTGERYDGMWKSGKKDGNGIMYFDKAGNNWYSGEFVGELRHGFGRRCYGEDADSAEYSGSWCEGVRHGAGLAKWVAQKQEFVGYWDKGVQDGTGCHTWTSERAPAAQFQLQNSYVGQFSAGKRQGKGAFRYASGARYEGSFENDIKHGPGRIVFKNGQECEGTFDNDKLVDFPLTFIDLCRTPDPSLFAGRFENNETVSAALILRLPTLLSHSLFDNTGADADDEFLNSTQRAETAGECCAAILCHASELRRIFSFYVGLAVDSSGLIKRDPANSSRCMIRFLWWRLLRDSRLPTGPTKNIKSRIQLDRLLARLNLFAENEHDVHDPYSQMSFVDFLLMLMATALLHFGYGRPAYAIDFPLPRPSGSIGKFLTDFILPNSCNLTNGRLFSDFDKEVNCKTMAILPDLLLFYDTLADVKVAENDRTMSARQLIISLTAAGIAEPTGVITALIEDMGLAPEENLDYFDFSTELTVMVVGEVFARLAEDAVEIAEIEFQHQQLQQQRSQSAGTTGAEKVERATPSVKSDIVAVIATVPLEWTQQVSRLVKLPDLAKLPMTLQRNVSYPSITSTAPSSAAPSARGRSSAVTPAASEAQATVTVGADENQTMFSSHTGLSAD